MILDISKQRLNYDKIAHLYDEPIRDYAVDPNLLQYLEQLGDYRGKKRVLDLGCGTGKQLTADFQRLSNIQFVGLDLFSGMLRVAQRRGPDVGWVQGDIANAPFASDSFDYITNQFSYQHVQQQGRLIEEIYRLLGRDGRFTLNNIDPWHMREWVIYQFFPATWELDMADFLTAEQLVSLMETAGFGRIEVSRRNIVTEMTLTEVYEYASTRSRASQFMAISDEDYASGLRTAEQALKSRGAEATIQSTFCFLTLIGNKD
jgi:SAM-dependent methyltransferase